MNRAYFSLALVMLVVATPLPLRAGTAAHLWSRGFGSVAGEYAWGVDVDAAGSTFVAGYFSGTINLGGADLTSAGNTDIFVAKYSPGGTHLWSQRFGGTSYDYAMDLCVDAQGKVLVTGYFQGTANFGGADLTSAGSYDVFVAKFSSNGVHNWSLRQGGTSSDYALRIASDGLSRAVITGYFQGTTNLGGAALTSAGGSDVFLAQYNSSGSHAWSQAFGGTGDDQAQGLGTDGTGTVVMTGAYSATASFGGASLTSSGSRDIFVARYSSAGVHEWSRGFGNTLSDYGKDVGIDGSGNVVLTGYFYGTVNFGGWPLTNPSGSDVFLAKYNASGTHLWSRNFSGTSSNYAWSVDITADGSLLLAGEFWGTANFGGSDLTSTGYTDGFIARYDAAGDHQWSRGFGGPLGSDAALGIVADSAGRAVVAGIFEDQMNLGGDDLLNGGSRDVFVARFGALPAEPVIASVQDVGNDQGRRVHLQFRRSGGDDALASYPVERYAVFLRDGSPAAAATVADGGGLPPVGTLASGWTEVGSVGAYGDESYGIYVPTLGDSTIADGQFHSAYFVRAVASPPTRFFDSAPDSGYSLDNLAPGAPQNLALAAGQLTWDESAAADFDFFTVYGGTSDSFGAAAVIDHVVAPALDVAGAPYPYYFVTSTDFAGNEGAPSRLAGGASATDSARSWVLSVGSYPNPFNARTTVRFTVPRAGVVTVALYDTRGARVAMLVDGETLAAGAHSLEWNGYGDDGGALPSGVYQARIVHEETIRVHKVVLVK